MCDTTNYCTPLQMKISFMGMPCAAFLLDIPLTHLL